MMNPNDDNLLKDEDNFKQLAEEFELEEELPDFFGDALKDVPEINGGEGATIE